MLTLPEVAAIGFRVVQASRFRVNLSSNEEMRTFLKLSLYELCYAKSPDPHICGPRLVRCTAMIDVGVQLRGSWTDFVQFRV